MKIFGRHMQPLEQSITRTWHVQTQVLYTSAHMARNSHAEVLIDAMAVHVSERMLNIAEQVPKTRTSSFV